MKVLMIALLSLTLHGYAAASECYRPYVYQSEANFLSAKMAASSKNQIDGVLHIRTRMERDKIKDVMYFFDAKKLAVAVAGDASDMAQTIANPVKVSYQKDGLPEKSFFFDGRKNIVLKGIVRDLLYIKQDGQYAFNLDEMDSRYQVEIKDRLMKLKPLDIESSLQNTKFITADYQVNLSNDPCIFFDEAKSSSETLQTSNLMMGNVSVKSAFSANLDQTAILPAEHWFMKMRFDDELWSGPKFDITSSVSEDEAKKQIASLVDLFRNNLKDEEFLEQQMAMQDTWLTYLAEFLAENDIDEDTSKKLFLMLGKLNTRLAVEVLNKVAQKQSVHEDHRFRAVAALMTTDAAISDSMLSGIQNIVSDNTFINGDVSTKAYIMSLGLVAANRDDTAPGQTSGIRASLIQQLQTPEMASVPVINAVGNLSASADADAIYSLEAIATSAAPQHQKVSSISSLARLENTTFSVEQIQYQLEQSKSPEIQKEWLGLAASSKTLDKHSSKSLLLTVAENPQTDHKVRDSAVVDMATKLPEVLDETDKQRLRKLLPSIQSKEAKASIYQVLVN